MDYFSILTTDRKGLLRKVTYVFNDRNPYVWYRRKAYKKARWKRAETRSGLWTV